MPNYDSQTNDVQLWKFLLDRPDRVDDFQGLLGSAAGRRKALYLLESFSNRLDSPSALETKFADRLDDDLPWIDDVGRSLEDYPRPSLAVDTAVLTVPEPMDSTSYSFVAKVVRANPRGLYLARSFIQAKRYGQQPSVRCVIKPGSMDSNLDSCTCLTVPIETTEAGSFRSVTWKWSRGMPLLNRLDPIHWSALNLSMP